MVKIVIFTCSETLTFPGILDRELRLPQFLGISDALAYDTMLKVHQQRCGFNSSRVSECGHGIEDAHHFLLECALYKNMRTVLKDQIRSVWENTQNSDNDGRQLSLFHFFFSVH